MVCWRAIVILRGVLLVILNAIRSVSEQRGRGTGERIKDYDDFNQSIDANALIYLPLCGRGFTWYRGVSMSWLDRFLLSKGWCIDWPNCIQSSLHKGVSSHCSLVLSLENENWGSRPLRMLKCWVDFPGYKNFVKGEWSLFIILGWRVYVLMEKLKLIKESLKSWHRSYEHNLVCRI